MVTVNKAIARCLAPVVALFFGCGVLSGCGSAPAPAPQTQAQTPAPAPPGSAVISAETLSLPPAQLPKPAALTQDEAYTLGPNDIISISVYLHPELSVPQAGSTTGSGGVLITSDGSVTLPLIGSVNLNGLTIGQAQRLIASDYAGSVVNPDVTIQLIQAESLRYYLLGAFSSPGVKFPGHKMPLLDALALGGSVDIANADLYQAFVTKGSTKLPVDLHALLIDGDLSQNIMLDSGDTVVIPPATNENAFVFGAVGKPGPITFQSGALSLLQALSASGLDLPNYTSARLSQVHLIRAHGSSAEFLVIDATKILNGQALPFALQPGDIVFVPPTAVASWNQVLDMLLPSLSTVSGVLNPFVSIKYLSQRNN